MVSRRRAPPVVLRGFKRRNPHVVAWERWRASEEGHRCLELATLAPGPYLANRLQLAFEAAWRECERHWSSQR